MKKHVYRVGDKVRIVTPELFVRCGYPLTVDAVMEEIEKNPHDRAAIGTFMDSFGVYLPKNFDHETNNKRYRLYQKLSRIMARQFVQDRGFGGNKREIYTLTCPELQGAELVIDSKRRVVTGEYYAGSSGSWEYAYDYDPAYLDKAQQHIILRGWIQSGLFPDGADLSIEAANVEPVP